MQQLRGHRLPARSSICSSRKDSVAQLGRQRHIAHAHRRQQAQRTVSSQQQPQQQQQPQEGLLGRVAVAAAAAALVCAPMAIPPNTALAADSVKIGTCLLQKCQVELAKCLGDPKCFQNIVCLNTCNGLSPEDEAACQIRCGDLYGDKAVDTFNACAVSEEKCVPQRGDEGLFPVPPDCALDQSFDLNSFTGRWYITAGLNPLFDTFDCQEHYFAIPEPGKLAAKINWRINKPNGDFIERSVVQTFVETGDKAVLFNGNNEYLHYQDTWYILGYKPDSYVVIYYRGKNDAWDGYGGATVYTKARQLPQELVPEISAAAERAGLKWSEFKLTDNTCKPHPPAKSLIQELEEGAEAVEQGVVKEAQVIEEDLEKGLLSFGRGFTVLEDEVSQELAAELKQAKRALEKVEREVAKDEKLLERELQTEVQGIESAFSRVLGIFKR